LGSGLQSVGIFVAPTHRLRALPGVQPSEEWARFDETRFANPEHVASGRLEARQ
jgi:hypothetical protein